jgi:hypothetical protein
MFISKRVRGSAKIEINRGINTFNGKPDLVIFGEGGIGSIGRCIQYSYKNYYYSINAFLLRIKY